MKTKKTVRWTKPCLEWSARLELAQDDLARGLRPVMLGAGLQIYAASLAICGELTPKKLLKYDAATKAGHWMEHGEWHRLGREQAERICELLAGKKMEQRLIKSYKTWKKNIS